MLEAA